MSYVILDTMSIYIFILYKILQYQNNEMAIETRSIQRSKPYYNSSINSNLHHKNEYLKLLCFIFLNFYILINKIKLIFNFVN